MRQNIPRNEKEDDGKKGDQGDSDREEEKFEVADDIVVDQGQDGLFYYSANEKAYRVIEPATNTWTT